MSKEVKEPAVRMIKRDTISTAKAWGIRLIAVVLSLIVAGLVIVAITKQNPLQVYLGIVDGAVGSSRRVWVTIRETLVLLCIAIGLTPAFKMKFWNIGAEGQILMGGMATAALMIYAGDAMPNWLLLILIFIASATAGLIWGLIPAVFKAYFNTNETLFTLMLNYVAMQLVTFAIVFWENPSGSNRCIPRQKRGFLPIMDVRIPVWLHKGCFSSIREELRRNERAWASQEICFLISANSSSFE